MSIRRALAISATLAAAGMAGPLPAYAAPATPQASAPSGFTVHQFVTGPSGQSSPDDIARLGKHLFVAYQNGVGSDGKPAPSGATKSTVYEYTLSGQVVASWPLTGKVDGLGADPEGDRVIATVNEDGNSSAYTIAPSRSAAEQVHHYAYTGLTHGGGTDSVLAADGKIYFTASAPAADANGTTYSKPALYTGRFTQGAAGKEGTIALTPVLNDNSTAADRVTGKSSKLNLSDPDSSEKVPAVVPGAGGDLLLDSQGDKQQIYIGRGHVPSVLNLNTQVDDTAFATTTTGTLYVVDSKANKILAITGHFAPGQAFTSVPGDSDSLKGVLGSLDLKSGRISTFLQLSSPKGLLFTNDGYQGGNGQGTGGSTGGSTTGGSTNSGSTGGSTTGGTTGSGSTGGSSTGTSAGGSTSTSGAGANGSSAQGTDPSPSGALARTGAGDPLAIAGAAAVLLAVGGGLSAVIRRRSARAAE
ncbi:hypothetical protein AB5J72_06235 [Streptomyces sp. CG1]|uniref:hypothetical protein n=1 Tax=Streptomyces sp. CG1 TaxID=1287523 RepID=UPI0034E1B46B